MKTYLFLVLASPLLLACGDDTAPAQPMPDAPPPEVDGRAPLVPEILYMRWNAGPELVVGTGEGQITPLRKLNGGVDGAGQTSRSRDGTRIAFSTYDDEANAWALITRPFEQPNANERVLAHTNGVANPAWSPDGSQLAYVTFVEAFTYGVFVVPSEGGTPKLLARVEVGSGDQALCIAPQWSPDGRELVYSTVHGLSSYRFSDAKERELVPRGDAFWTCAPQWAPDGSAIAFAWGDPGVGKIAKISRDGGDVTALAPMEGGFGTGQVAWSPDGSQIAYVTLFEDDVALRVVPASGGPSRLLDKLQASIEAGHPTFSTDSATVLYVRFSEGARLMTVPAAGGEITDLHLEGAHIGASYPIWLRP
ncbi:MAG: hypothetical protein R3B48_11675 [Kofleriaceae bacterium]